MLFIIDDGLIGVEVTLLDQPAFDETSTVWTINNLQIALGIEQETHRHYVREEVKSLIAALDEKLASQDDKRIIWPVGPPGTGKSTNIFGWAMSKALDTNTPSRKGLLYMHEAPDLYEILEVTDGVGKKTSVSKQKLNDWFNLVVGSKDIVIMDGFRTEMISVIITMGKKYPGAMLIPCTSYQSGATNSETAALFQYSEFQSYSWTFEDLERAVAAGVLVFTDDYSLVEHHFYCGGSMRLMLQDLVHAIQFIDRNIKRVDNAKDLLSGLQGISSPLCMNSLIQLLPGNGVCLLSEYVCKKLSMCADMDFIETAKNVSRNNPAWQGWVFELEFLTRVQIASKHPPNTITLYKLNWWGNFFAAELQEKSFEILNMVDYTNTTIHHLRDGTFFTPMKWNQGCYDAVYYRLVEGIHHVYFLQCTISVTHQFKFQYCGDFLENLFPSSDGVFTRSNSSERTNTNLKVHFYVVTRKENANIFHFGTNESIESVTRKDPTFNAKRMKVVYL